MRIPFTEIHFRTYLVLADFEKNSLIFSISDVSAYRLYTVVPKLVKFIDELTNWYVRMNRRRIKVGAPNWYMTGLRRAFLSRKFLHMNSVFAGTLWLSYVKTSN